MPCAGVSGRSGGVSPCCSSAPTQPADGDKRTSACTTPPGLTFRAVSKSDRYVFEEVLGSRDQYLRDLVLPMMRGGVVVDVGAHKGFFALLAASVAAWVVALEPDTENSAYLRRNVKANRAANVTV